MEEKIKKVFNLVFAMTVVKNQKKKELKKNKTSYLKYSVSPI